MQGVLKPREVKKIVQETLKLKRKQALLQIGQLRILFIDQSQVPLGLQPAVCSTAPAPASATTQPSPGNESVPSHVDDGLHDPDDFSGYGTRSGVAPPKYNEKGERISKPPEDPSLKGPPFDPGDD